MQPLTAAPRDALSADQVRWVLAGSPSVTYRFGCDLLNSDGTFVEDISDDLVRGGSKVDSGSYRDLHRSAVLVLSRELDWARDRIRPWMVVSDPRSGLEVKAYLGVYLLDTPQDEAGAEPRVWEVECYDTLHLLDTPIGETWTVAAGTGALASARALIEHAGETRIRFSEEGDDIALPSGRVWPISADNTYRRAVNDLFGLIGYRGVWTDWEGWFRSEPYRSPTERSPEWTYTTDDLRTRVVGTKRALVRDWFDLPNVWIGRRKDDPAQGEPVDGNGLYRVVNQSDGPTSIDARGGRVVRRVLDVDAADQSSLVRNVDRSVEADKALITRVELTSAPNPLHWHHDIVTYTDADLGLSGRFLGMEWTLPLDGSDMRHVLKAV